MSRRDEILLDALEENILLAPKLGVCSLSFIVLRDIVREIIAEKDAALELLAQQQNVKCQ